MNISTDFLLASLPIPLVWQLQLNKRTKISLIFVLSLGLFACIAAIMRVRLTKTVLSDPNRFVHDEYSLWNTIELNVGIVAASLPAIKPLINRFLDVARVFKSGLSKPSAQGDRDTSGYQKHDQHSDRGIALVDYGTAGKPAVSISANAPNSTNKVVWNINRASGSEDSILPHTSSNDASKVIVVTQDICVN